MIASAGRWPLFMCTVVTEEKVRPCELVSRLAIFAVDVGGDLFRGQMHHRMWCKRRNVPEQVCYFVRIKSL